MFGRGVTTSFLQAREVLRLIDEHGADAVTIGESFDAWCSVNMQPWVDDHVRMDDTARRLWAGDDLDLDARLPSNLIMAAVQVDPSIAPALGPYLSMEAGRASTPLSHGPGRCTPRAGGPASTPARAGVSSWSWSGRPCPR